MLYLLFRFLRFTIPLFPLNFLYSIAEMKGRFFYYVIPVRKRVALRNLRFVYHRKPGNEIRHILKECYVNVIKIIIEFFYIPRLINEPEKINKIINIRNPELIKAALEKGKGVILISGHFGNWELTAVGGSYILKEKFHIIVKEQSNKKIDLAVNEIREMNGNELIYMHEGLRKILSLLHQNKIVVFLSDQSAPKDGSVPVHFFADNVPTFEGAARFAMKTGAAVLFGAPHRNEDNTFDITFKNIDTSKHNTVESLTQAHASLLEEHIRQQPELWLWFHKRFKNVKGISYN